MKRLRNWTLMADLQTDMLSIANEYKRLVRKNLSDEKQMEKVDEDIKITLGPLFTDKLQKQSVMMGEMFQTSEKGEEHSQAVFEEYLAMFNNFIEARVYNNLIQIAKERETSEPGKFSERAGAAAGYLPQIEEKKLTTLKPPEIKEEPQAPAEKPKGKKEKPPKGDEEIYDR